MPILFCNIAWMVNYAGRSDTDPPRGGGDFPEREGYCTEECNFVPCLSVVRTFGADRGVD